MMGHASPAASRTAALQHLGQSRRRDGDRVEEFMHAGLFDDEPRAREIVWSCSRNAARGLGSQLLRRRTT
jgi:hypothetical protein